MEEPIAGEKNETLLNNVKAAATTTTAENIIKSEIPETNGDVKMENKEKVVEAKSEPSDDEKDIKPPTENGVQEDLKIDIENDSSINSIYDTLDLEKEPLFAEICSFFNFFATYLNMKPISFVKLEKMFSSSNDEVNPDLIDLHLSLLRKIGYKAARFDKWETFLHKFLVFNKAEEESVLLERLGYFNVPLTTKLEMLFQLCGRQFDFNLKFKESIYNTYNPCELRLAPIGKDRNGLSYWFQRDHDLNVRLYTEEPEDESGGTWSLIAKSHNEIIKLIESLKRTDFGAKDENNDDDGDEESQAALEVSMDSKKSSSQQNGTKKKEEETPQLSPGFWKLLKPDVAQKYYAYLAKRNTFKDEFRDGTELNKRKNEKFQKKEAKTNANAAPTTSSQAATASTATPKSGKRKSEDKDVSKEEEELPEIPPELLEDRRILPRRTARSNAITNLKNITTPSRANNKKATPAVVATPIVVEEKKKEETPEEETDDDDGEDMDDEDDSDQSLGASDEEFNLPGKKEKQKRIKKQQRRAPRIGNDDDDGRDTPKPKKKKKKVTNIAFEESSDEEEEQQQEEIKEKRKATALTLCMQCHKSSKPDVLLLCDMCDDAWHTFCLKPSLHYVPDDDWFCPTCHHAMLVDRLIKVEDELKDALKIKEAEESKKKTAADRLKREMEYIGVSLNNVIPSSSKQDQYQSLSESTESEDDGQRKSKKKAMKKVMRHSHPKKERYYGPVITVAEGRTRRSTKKVDYKFSAYDEQLQEAMDVIDEPSTKTKYDNDHRPTGGLGRGKDMANIAEAQRKRSHDSEDFEDENDEPVKKQRKHKTKKLTDLDIDNATESEEDDEYRASDAEAEEAAEPSEEEYVPSDIERRQRRSGAGGRRRSDEEFINDGGSDSDYAPSGKKKKGRQLFGKSRRSGFGRSKRKRGGLDSDEEDEEESDAPEYQSESSDDGYRKKRKPPPSKPTSSKKRVRKGSDSEDDEEEDIDDNQGESSDSGPIKKTARGRPMRKAAAKAVPILKESDDEDMDEDGEEASTKKKTESRPVGALTRKLEEDEFKPEDVGEDDEEEEEEEEEEEVDDEKEVVESEEDDDLPDTGEEEEDEDGGDTPSTKVPSKKRKAPTPPPAVAKKTKKETFPAKSKKDEKIGEPKKEEEATPVRKVSTLSATAATATTTASPAPSTPKLAPTPPRQLQQLLTAPSPQHAGNLMAQLPTSLSAAGGIQQIPNIRGLHPLTPFSNNNGFPPPPSPYSIPMSSSSPHHQNPIRFSLPPQPHPMYGGAPPGFYGPPPPMSSYGHPVTQPMMMPTYVMQPPPQHMSYDSLPPGMLPHHGFPPSNLTMLEPLQPMHPITSLPPQLNNPYGGGLQPIHLSSSSQQQHPSDSDGLAQAIAGAMNTDL